MLVVYKSEEMRLVTGIKRQEGRGYKRGGSAIQGLVGDSVYAERTTLFVGCSF